MNAKNLTHNKPALFSFPHIISENEKYKAQAKWLLYKTYLWYIVIVIFLSIKKNILLQKNVDRKIMLTLILLGIF